MLLDIQRLNWMLPFKRNGGRTASYTSPAVVDAVPIRS